MTDVPSSSGRRAEQLDRETGPQRAWRALATVVDRTRSRAGTESRQKATVFVVFVLATVMRGVGEFRYDALYYWWGAQSVIGAIPAAPPDYWPLRGVLTGFVYVPSAWLSSVVGEEFSGSLVLLQNSIVLGILAAVLLPAVLSGLGVTSSGARWWGAGLTWLCTSGFAAYPLVDIYPAVACIAIAVLLMNGHAWALLASGVLAGVAINVRPAYALVIALVLVTVACWRRFRSLWMVAGVPLGLLPQVVWNALRFDSWSPWPPDSGALAALQSSLASYIVRYDTLFGAPEPQVFYCSPSMARELAGSVPLSMGELASAFLGSVPTSIGFALQKIAAALHWPLSTPYTVPNPGLDGPFAAVVTAIAVLGVGVLIREIVRARRQRATDRLWLAVSLSAIVVGSIGTLVTSATESRFALPMVLVGIIGCAVAAGLPVRPGSGHGRVWLALGVVVAVATIALGYAGLAHPTPVGAFDVATCSSL